MPCIQKWRVGYFHLLGKYIVSGYCDLRKSHGEVSSQDPLRAYMAQAGAKAVAILQNFY